MKRCSRVRVLASVLGLGSLLGASLANAVVVEATVTQASPGAFLYAVSVTNDESVDLALVSLSDAPVGDTAISSGLSGPIGHSALYDPDFGIIHLVDDDDAFASGTTVAGFSFTSESLATTGVFERFDAYTTEADVITGTIDVTVPEPQLAGLAATGCLYFLLLIGRDTQRVSCARAANFYARRRFIS